MPSSSGTVGPREPPAGLLHTCKCGFEFQDQDQDQDHDRYQDGDQDGDRDQDQNAYLGSEETASSRLCREGEPKARALAGLRSSEMVGVDVDVRQELK